MVSNTPICHVHSNACSEPLTYRQPFKGIYIASRLLALCVLLPSWALYYTLLSRPRKSWTIKETVSVHLVRWNLPLNAACGLSPQSTDKTRAVSQKELKETSFVWLEPADSTLVRGIAQDGKISPVCVPAYIWPKGDSLGKDGGLVGRSDSMSCVALG